MQRPINQSVATTEKSQILFSLQELDDYLRTYLPDVHVESLAAETINNLKKTINKPYLSFRMYYPAHLQAFAIFVRGCIRMRCSMYTNLDLESTCIHIKQWPEIKKDLTSKGHIELLLIASKFTDEIYAHLKDIAVDLRCSEITKLLDNNIPKTTTKRSSAQI